MKKTALTAPTEPAEDLAAERERLLSELAEREARLQALAAAEEEHQRAQAAESLKPMVDELIRRIAAREALIDGLQDACRALIPAGKRLAIMTRELRELKRQAKALARESGIVLPDLPPESAATVDSDMTHLIRSVMIAERPQSDWHNLT